MNIGDILKAVSSHVAYTNKPYFEILGEGINLNPVGFMDYILGLGLPLEDRDRAFNGNSKYEFSVLAKYQETHPHIVKQYFEDTPEVRLEWETVDSIIKLLRRDERI